MRMSVFSCAVRTPRPAGLTRVLPEPEPVEGVFLTKREDGYAINYQHHLVNSTSMSYIVRDALPSEDATIAVLYHNAFINSWNHNYFPGATSPPEPFAAPDHGARGLKNPTARLRFYRAVVASVRLAKSHRVRVLVNVETGKEIVGAAMWSAPGHPMPEDPWSLLRTGFVRVILSYGLSGYKRVMAYEKVIKMMQVERFQGDCRVDGRRSIRAQTAFLQMVATSSSVRGQGLGGLLLADGETLFPPGTPLLLDASEEKPRDVYLKAGYELIGQAPLDVGEKIGENGCAVAEVEKAYERLRPLYLMIKWR